MSQYTHRLSARWNALAIAGFVCVFLFSPLAIVFGAIGLAQIGRTGERGKVLAILAVVLGAAKLLASIAKAVIAAVFGWPFGALGFTAYIW